MQYLNVVLSSYQLPGQPDYLNHYFFTDPILGSNFTYPNTANGSLFNATTGTFVYPATASGGPFYPWGYSVQNTYTIMDLGILKGPYTLTFVPSAIDNTVFTTAKILYAFGDGQTTEVEKDIVIDYNKKIRFAGTDSAQVGNPNFVNIDHEYYPQSTGTTTYNPMVSVINGNFVWNVFDIRFSLIPASMYDFNDLTVLNSVGISSDSKNVIVVETNEPRYVANLKVLSAGPYSLVPTPTPTHTPTPPLPSQTPTQTPVPSETPTQTPTCTPTTTPTNTPTPSITPTITITNSPTPSKTPTQTVTPSQTPTNTPTVTPTQTPSVTPSQTPSETPTNTPTPSITPTQTSIIVETPTPTPSETPASSPTPTPTPTVTYTPQTLLGCGTVTNSDNTNTTQFRLIDFGTGPGINSITFDPMTEGDSIDFYNATTNNLMSSFGFRTTRFTWSEPVGPGPKIVRFVITSSGSTKDWMLSGTCITP